MIHLRTDSEELNANRRFACGIGPSLPDGDKWVYETEYGLRHMVDCPACGGEKVELGVPASQMNGNAAQRHLDPQAWDNWVRFSNACGYP